MLNEKCCAIILAAGDGKRMKSEHPKVMCKVLFKPMISWVVDWCEGAGIHTGCVVVGAGAEEIAPLLPKGFDTAVQKERKGTGHAVMMARKFIEENSGKDILVLCGDAPFVDSSVIQSSYEAHKGSGAAVTIITADLQNPFGYGRIVREGEKVLAIAEEKDCTPEQSAITEVNSGSYWFRGDFLPEALGSLTCSNAQGEYYLTDAIEVAAKQGLTVCACKCGDEGIVLGANHRAGLLELNRIATKKVLDLLMLEGVNFYSTDGIVISPDAVIGADTTIGAGTIIKGRTTIGKGTLIEGGCIIEDSVIGDDCTIQSSVIEHSRIGNGARIGPNAHLRPGTELADYVKVGNFVEIKNSVIGEKSSIAHLSYIGDSDVGRHVNMGCGCAVANYDGVHKHRTTVEDFAFLGCHTSLIAPVRIGNGAYTGAGSVITTDVPKDALGVARAKQRNIEGWAKAWRLKNDWQRYFDKRNKEK